MIKIGKYELYAVESGYFGLDGGAMFGIIPKPLWERNNVPDSANRVTLATRTLLLKSGSRKILIDTGTGNKWNDKSAEIYNFNPRHPLLRENLINTGTTPDEITDVILTHLHFDHAGGSTLSEKGKLIPAFPNAKYYVQEKNFNWAMEPSERDKGSYIKENFTPLKEEGVLNFFNGNCMFDDEIELINVHGHTFYQQLVKISDGSDTILYCADLFPFVSHIALPYIMGYDLQPLETLKEKKKMLARAADENWKLFFEHDPEIVIASVVKTDKGYKVNETLKSI
jgi:glyoxylase-like metal-dependent hydrolase (beta-lactamase superfamily II)